MRRALIATLVAALCVTAGCSTGGTAPTDTAATGDTTAPPATTDDGEAESTGEGTATDDGDATTTGATDDPADPGAIPGVEGGQVADLDALFAANGETLAERDFVRTRTLSFDYLAGATRPNWTTREVERYEAGEARVVRSRTANESGPEPFVYESTLYADDEGAIFRDRNDEPGSDGYGYRRLSGEAASVTPTLDTVEAFRLQRFVERANFTIDGTRSVDGDRLYVFTADEARGLSIPNGDLEAELVVDGRGQIRSLTATAVTRNETSGLAYRVTYRYRLQRVGDVTVETPEWVQERRGETATEEE